MRYLEFAHCQWVSISWNPGWFYRALIVGGSLHYQERSHNQNIWNMYRAKTCLCCRLATLVKPWKTAERAHAINLELIGYAVGRRWCCSAISISSSSFSCLFPFIATTAVYTNRNTANILASWMLILTFQFVFLPLLFCLFVLIFIAVWQTMKVVLYHHLVIWSGS